MTGSPELARSNTSWRRTRHGYLGQNGMRVAVFGVAVGSMAVLVGCTSSTTGGTTGSSSSEGITGSISMTGGGWGPGSSATASNGDSCFASSTNSSVDRILQPGTQVVIKDAAGVILGSGELADGRVVPYAGGHTCGWAFSVPSAKHDSEQYQLELAGQQGKTYSKAQMESNGWNIALEVSQRAFTGG